MKPRTPQAMEHLLGQIREAIPFDLHESALCDGVCQGCSKKVLDFLENEIESWDYRLKQGEVPTFTDLTKLARRSKKIHGILQRNGLIDEAE